jgi:hypothetical protein
MKRIANLFFAAVAGLIALLMIVAVMSSDNGDDAWEGLQLHRGQADQATEPQLRPGTKPETLSAEPDTLSAEPETKSPTKGLATSARYRVHIRKPEGPPKIKLAGTDPQGRSGTVACSTCHSVRKPNLENKTTASLDEFHQGLQLSHGTLACYACHNPADADSLHLADGTSVQFTDVMTMCSQCHSKQAESFAHGAHGGMNGFWDLSRGPQNKNNCVDCHDPHAPTYPKMIVDFKPRDRFNTPSSHSHEEK